MKKANEVTVVEQPTGKLSLKHKAAIWAVGTFLVWFGERLRQVDTYEELESTIDEVDEKGKQLEEQHGEAFKEIDVLTGKQKQLT